MEGSKTSSSGGVPENKPAEKEAPAINKPEGQGASAPKRERSARIARQDPPDYLHMNNPQARGPRKPKEQSGDTESVSVVAELAYLGEELSDEPTYQQALKRPDSAQWRRAMEFELGQLRRMGTWELVPVPDGKNIVGNKWVLRIKRDSQGDLVKYKARLVAQGFTQEPGTDFTETFAPVMRLESLRLILAIGNALDLEIDQMDVVGAYLHGKLDEEIYMRQPAGFDDGSGQVCKLKRALYGLRQAGREWNKVLDSFLLHLRFRRCATDMCVYIRTDDGYPTFLAVHVDDLTMLAKTRQLMDRLKDELKSRFEMTDLGSVRQIVGIEVIRDRSQRKMMLRQSAYIKKVLDRFRMMECNPVSTPLDLHTQLVAASKDVEAARVPYREAVGSLMYAAVGTRPDLAFPVQALSQYCECPTDEHWGAIKRTMRYLRGTLDWGIVFEPSNDSIILSGYTDADWGANRDDRKSISGQVFYLCGGPIVWASRKQKSVAISTMEAEYMAAADAVSQALWCRTLLAELGFSQDAPTTLHMDNQSAIAFSKNTGSHGRAKHVDIRYHFVRDRISSNEISVVHCAGTENPADVFTKVLSRFKFEDARALLNMSASRGSVGK